MQIWTMLDPKNAKDRLDNVQLWISNSFTWAYAVTHQIWILFMIVLYISPLGKIKLGKPSDTPGACAIALGMTLPAWLDCYITIQRGHPVHLPRLLASPLLYSCCG